jgi:NOL1/NOP2/fmu family ribosome biogenesis protein
MYVLSCAAIGERFRVEFVHQGVQLGVFQVNALAQRIEDAFAVGRKATRSASIVDMDCQCFM